MHTISLLTDFGDKDNFVGVMKAVILKINPRAKIIDLCHQVGAQDVLEAAFLLKSSFRYFPKGTVHLIVIDPGVGSRRRKIIVETKDYFFVAPDNGVLSPVVQSQDIQGIIEITKEKYFLKPISDTFHGRDIFAPVAAYLSLGRRIGDFGKRIKSIKHLSQPSPKRLKNELIGEVIYIDHFGNLITNITESAFLDFIKERAFKVCFAGLEIKKISHSYQEGKKNQALAIFGSFGNLEIALVETSAKEHLSVNKGTSLKIIKCE